MLLAIDIGNTNMEFGIFDGERLAGSFRLGTNRDITSDEVGLFTSQFFRENDFDRREIEDVVITSVVPQVMYSISNAVKKYFYGKVPLVAGDNLPFQIENRYEQPKEVGADPAGRGGRRLPQVRRPVDRGRFRHRDHLRRGRRAGRLPRRRDLPRHPHLDGGAVHQDRQAPPRRAGCAGACHRAQHPWQASRLARYTAMWAR